MKGICVIAATLGVVACTDYDSLTNLNTEGPPQIQQVRMWETFMRADTGTFSDRRLFAFGTHPNVTSENEAHPVTSARAGANSLRVIIDELLIGNNLEEVACRANINAAGAFSRVPLGATPDDISRCSQAQDILPRTCTGPLATCICDIEAGCLVDQLLVERGAPVGVLDTNQDGSADDTQLIGSAVQIQCGTINVPLDPATSYWNPSGNQQVPAMGGYDALGPAIVLVPLTGLPVNQTCRLVFDASVVDKQNNQVCAPVDGDVTLGCDAGDVSAFQFSVEGFRLVGGPPMTGANRSGPFIFQANTNVNMATLAASFVITPTPPAPPTVTLEMGRNIRMVFPTPLAPNTTYTITFNGLTDSYGQGSPTPFTFTFTTGA